MFNTSFRHFTDRFFRVVRANQLSELETDEPDQYLFGRDKFNEDAMSQSPNRMFDEFAKLMTDAAGVAQGAKREVETAFRAQMERFMSDMDLVSRDEFDAVKDMAIKALDEVDKLEERLSAVEERLAALDETAKSDSSE
ncbi:Membrane fusogenic activity [Pseudovibrio axinellae]|uniref:Membrane fusogenic activity n=2 Tax=Pseudovibrio axinellae TaxID=989403 RepID=A0A165XUV8_9HYPH|nr:Membrane fusogenic activity [Pseudovibrio axinellae]SER11594.1 BMFP domain-containing protein YqiC [Pseudovibrio axinellae]